MTFGRLLCGVLWLILHQHWARHYHPDGKDYLIGSFLSNFRMRVLRIFPNETHSLHHSQKTAQTYLHVTIISFLSLIFSDFQISYDLMAMSFIFDGVQL